MRCHSLLQGVFLTQGSNLRLLCWQVDSLPLHHLGGPAMLLLLIMQMGRLRLREMQGDDITVPELLHLEPRSNRNSISDGAA